MTFLNTYVTDDGDDYDTEESQDQKKLMPPPSWIPQQKPVNTTKSETEVRAWSHL